MTRSPRFLTASALTLALLATPLFVAAAPAEPQAQPAALPLGRALSSFAGQQGVALSFDPALTAGRSAPAVADGLSVEAGFNQLLAGSGLRARRRADGSYTVERAAGKAPMPALRVEANAASTYLPSQLPYGQGTRLDEHALQAQVKGNGDIATALRSNPAVQFSDRSRTTRNMGEIRPDDFSINGAPYYQNLFLLDGASFNNDLDPVATAVGTTENTNHNSDVPSAAQGIAVDVDLLESLTVYDANVPAAYGGFTGGVVDARTRGARDAFGGKVWMRMARSAWDQIITNPAQDTTYEESATLAYQPAYDKYRVGARLEGRTQGGLGIIGTVVRSRSEIPLRAYTAGRSTPGNDVNQRTQTRENTAATVALDWSSDTLDLRLGLGYAPTDDRYFIANTKNSWFDLKSGGPTANLSAVWRHGAWTLSQRLSYSDLESSRRSEETTMRHWRPSQAFDWGVAAVSSEGSWGSVDQHDRKLGYTLSVAHDTVTVGRTAHDVQGGLSVQRRDANYKRLNDQYVYQSAVATRSCTLSDGRVDSVSCSLSPLLDGSGNGQYLSMLQLFHAGEFSVSGEEYAAWLQDDIRIGNWSVRPGLRLDRDNVFNQTNLSPRLAVSWDVFGDEDTRINAGVNRYYGRSFFAYLLRDGRERLRESKTRRSASTAWEDVAGTWNVATNRLRDLDSPYADEWSLGLDQRVAGLRISAKYVDRRSRRDVLRRRIGEPLDATLYNRNTFEYTNDGRSDAGIATLTVASREPWTFLGTRNSWQLAADHTDVKRNYNSYEDTLLMDELVRYEGKLMYRHQLPATDYLRPWSARLGTRTEVPALGLTWNNSFSYRAGYQGIATGRPETIDGVSVPNLTRQQFSGTWTWDASIEYRHALPRDQEAYVRVEAQNVLNRSNLTSGVAGTAFYEPGRSFWLELGYTF
ncbi:secretin and TonB N-terminal domain-containing protein [Stenotrophomonas sp. LGBM10]|uniref:TonB-dependent receptor n=1 Tax=Stenotrophomonas sp. LGBM10 TaxID=3390038 RepID=UPI00398BA529